MLEMSAIEKRRKRKETTSKNIFKNLNSATDYVREAVLLLENEPQKTEEAVIKLTSALRYLENIQRAVSKHGP